MVEYKSGVTGNSLESYRKSAFRLEILIRQSAKVSAEEITEAYEDLLLKYNNLNEEKRGHLNIFLTPDYFKTKKEALK